MIIKLFFIVMNLRDTLQMRVPNAVVVDRELEHAVHVRQLELHT